MLLDHLIIFILLALLAEILGTIGGFGSSLFFVPLASFFLDFHSVLGITAIFHVSSNITKIAFFRKGFDIKLLIWIGIPAVIFVIIGAYLSQFIQSNILEILLAIFLILTSLTFLFFKHLEVTPTKKNSVIGGSFSGLVAGLIGTGGAIRGITLASFNLKMEVFIATSAIIDLGIDLSRSGVYYLNGYIHPHDLYLILPLLAASILGTYIGKKILERISEEKFKSMVLILIFITGIVTLLKIILG
ncbi:sulfite exporter TauE/SafE family protein [Lutibacter sp. HS1-25]|uniref:sulfite exporter TauE/SafE family protein n=1 Tax=Lutibacter sp. HS1-25 TaxID=2485000 RepID=UPI00101227A0|nr:sulfite exporter TauE/SafE family protein [Lutibacter sp. HS1-25]RXP54253.1 sulfite exporter TauE/SafE family protein [Lutibacter sp. HS1-25]